MDKFAIFLSTFIFSTWLIGKIRLFCLNKGMINEVNDRSSHQSPTVRGGGRLFALMCTPTLILLLTFSHPHDSGFLWSLVAGGLICATVGWLDDIKGLPPLPRFTAQAVAVGASLYFLPQMFDWIPLWLEKSLFFFAWLWFLNLFNFLDGIDGYAACESAFLSLILILFVPILTPLLLVMSATSIGFLRLNFNNKQKFQGFVQRIR